MLKPVGLDRVALRRSFNQRSTAVERADFLLSEVERRLDERLEPMQFEGVSCVLDLGCGLGRSLPVLARRFPQAELLALDMADGPLMACRRTDERARRGLQGLLTRIRAGNRPQTRPPHWIAADAHRLPLAEGSVSVIWSNLVFHWFDDPLAVLRECYRVLRPQGLLVFSAFGVDTCCELRSREADSSAQNLRWRQMPGDAVTQAAGQWPSLQDMHDWGDAMVEQGFDAPVMDTEHLRLTYTSAQALHDDLVAFGFPAVSDVMVPALTVELVFGHAWVPAQKARSDGLAPIHIIRKGQVLK
ncbi:MAG: methyltransferase domain-containing protein [Lautropia sp.]|nr:methyltransferase domain-containing protein [Lautropia sp.]